MWNMSCVIVLNTQIRLNVVLLCCNHNFLLFFSSLSSLVQLKTIVHCRSQLWKIMTVLIVSELSHLHTWILCNFKKWIRCLFASHLTKHFHFAESVWKLVVRLFLGIEPFAVSSSCKNKYVPTGRRFVRFENSHVPTVVSFSCKVMHILSKNYRRNIVKLLGNTYTFEKVHCLNI